MNVKKNDIIELRVDFPDNMEHKDLKRRMTSLVGVANRVATADGEHYFIARFKYPKSAVKAEGKIREILSPIDSGVQIAIQHIK